MYSGRRLLPARHILDHARRDADAKSNICKMALFPDRRQRRIHQGDTETRRRFRALFWSTVARIWRRTRRDNLGTGPVCRSLRSAPNPRNTRLGDKQEPALLRVRFSAPPCLQPSGWCSSDSLDPMPEFSRIPLRRDGAELVTVPVSWPGRHRVTESDETPARRGRPTGETDATNPESHPI